MQFHLPDYFAGDLVCTIAFGIVAIFLIVFGYIVFDKLTPKLDFDELLNKGNVALAIVVGSFIIGLCYVIGRVVSAILGGPT
jgi:putative membrane protein